MKTDDLRLYFDDHLRSVIANWTKLFLISIEYTRINVSLRWVDYPSLETAQESRD